MFFNLKFSFFSLPFSLCLSGIFTFFLRLAFGSGLIPGPLSLRVLSTQDLVHVIFCGVQKSKVTGQYQEHWINWNSKFEIFFMLFLVTSASFSLHRYGHLKSDTE